MVFLPLSRYPIELSGILQYIMNKLKTNETYDLVVLKELITNMSGMEATEDATAGQLEALSGGPVLCELGGSFALDDTPAGVKEKKKATSRLRAALCHPDVNNLLLPFRCYCFCVAN